jgi:tetratricopeptide (TPR) repeat protein
MYDAGFKPTLCRWLGFGISYFNPVQASAFLKEHQPGSLLYNSYNVGGYLIYDLYPAYKVFCDGRYFPYREWYIEYYNFNNGPTPLEDFIKEYPFDVAIVDYYSSDSPIMKFLKSRQWEPVFYGPAAMVFVRNDVEFEHDFRESDNHRFDELRNLTQANMALFVAQNLGDLEASAHILQLIDDKLSYYPGYAEVVEKGALMHNGLVAYAEGDYATAFTHLDKVADRAITIRASLALLNLRNWKCKELVKEGKYQDALAQLELTLKDQPTYVDGLYNAGILGYQVEVLRKQKKEMDALDPLQSAGLSLLQQPPDWRNDLRAFLQLAPDHRHAWVARQLLEGKTPPVNVPLIL